MQPKPKVAITVTPQLASIPRRGMYYVLLYPFLPKLKTLTHFTAATSGWLYLTWCVRVLLFRKNIKEDLWNRTSWWNIHFSNIFLLFLSFFLWKSRKRAWNEIDISEKLLSDLYLVPLVRTGTINCTSKRNYETYGRKKCYHNFVGPRPLSWIWWDR